MLELGCPDLASDPATIRVTKDEVVEVEFATAPGALESAVGLNHYAVGDALITGSTGDRWCVSRDRFDAKYRAEAPTLPGEAGRYRNHPVAVLAKRMTVAFSVERTAGGDVELEVGDGQFHIFPVFDFLPEARAATDRIGSFLGARFSPRPSQALP